MKHRRVHISDQRRQRAVYPAPFDVSAPRLLSAVRSPNNARDVLVWLNEPCVFGTYAGGLKLDATAITTLSVINRFTTRPFPSVLSIHWAYDISTLATAVYTDSHDWCRGLYSNKRLQAGSIPILGPAAVGAVVDSIVRQDDNTIDIVFATDAFADIAGAWPGPVAADRSVQFGAVFPTTGEVLANDTLRFIVSGDTFAANFNWTIWGQPAWLPVPLQFSQDGTY